MNALILLACLAQGGWKPTECMDNQFPGDLADAKEGRWVRYAMEAGGAKISQMIKVAGKAGDDWMIEQWMDTGALSYGLLYRLGKDKKIKKAWAAARGDAAWAEIRVNAPPKPAGDGPKPDFKETDEKKEVAGGTFACRRVDVSIEIGGKEYRSTTWYSKDAWKLFMGGEHGGIVALEASGTKTWLESKGEDAKPTIDLPKP
jgi:hypothetical protein